MRMSEQWGGGRTAAISFRNATIIVCFFNLITVLFLIHTFISPPSKPSNDLVLLKYIKESEELRLALEPAELIKRVREIEREAREEVETGQEKDAKQSAALDLISRLNNHRSYSDADNQKALEEWRKRKMERARQRGYGKNGTTSFQG
uniref:uncharacterized protein LOC122582272 n=1 Tax=Erigeron canadensis TaxID=72917 RepID=UPI001CB916E3|nr:uncharacterized protein LOC122582272 [Erigeron canadensis]